jgi:carbamoyltransferase
MDIARSIQDVCEEVMVKMASHVHDVTKLDNLCLAGGVALNCVGNGKILREKKFKNIWIQPAAGDAGGALGVALFIWYRYLNNARTADNVQDFQQGSYLGPKFNDDEIATDLKKREAVYEKLDLKDVPNRIAKLIADQKIVGLFQGRMEFGPRALGGRSIIADPRSSEMQSSLNLKTKFRESFRPFAPSVLDEKAEEYFEIDCPSPYMLLVADVCQEKRLDDKAGSNVRGLDLLKSVRSTIPAVTHVDFSARVQTVSKETNPIFYGIIEEFYNLTGCPVVINTSFNIRGEPIVCTPEDAYRCFMCTNMDYLLIDGHLIEREKQPHKEKYKKEFISTELD